MPQTWPDICNPSCPASHSPTWVLTFWQLEKGRGGHVQRLLADDGQLGSRRWAGRGWQYTPRRAFLGIRLALKLAGIAALLMIACGKTQLWPVN